MTAADGQQSVPSVGLQINLAPLDVDHAVHVLPHQLGAFAGQVDDVVLSIDLQPNTSSRYRTDDYEPKRRRLLELMEVVSTDYPAVRVEPVDYSEAATTAVSRTFGRGTPLPLRAADGSPFHAYLHGLMSARTDYVLHLDSDVFLGGRSDRWVRDAVTLMEADRQILAVNPLPGPPTDSGELRSQSAPRYAGRPDSFRFDGVSTRIFLMDKRRFASGELAVPVLAPELSRRVRALLNNTPQAQSLENSMGVLARRTGMVRVDTLGTDPGMWSLHPDGRSPSFYEELPTLLRRVEADDLPDSQRGYHDVVDEFFDWSEYRASRTRTQRLRRNLLWAKAGIAGRIRA